MKNIFEFGNFLSSIPIFSNLIGVVVSAEENHLTAVSSATFYPVHIHLVYGSSILIGFPKVQVFSVD